MISSSLSMPQAWQGPQHYLSTVTTMNHMPPFFDKETKFGLSICFKKACRLMFPVAIGHSLILYVIFEIGG